MNVVDPLLPPISPRTLDTFRHITSYPSRNEVVEQFNRYVRGSVRDRVLSLVGREVDIPLKWCLTVLMPSWWMGLAVTLSCECRDCEVSRLQDGFSNPATSNFNSLLQATPTKVQLEVSLFNLFLDFP